MSSPAINQKSEASLHAGDYLQILRNRWKEAVLVFVLVFVAAAVATYLMPPSYTSVINFEIKKPGAIVSLSRGAERVLQNNASENYIPTQFEILVSDMNLMAVSKKLNLAQQWQTDDATAASILRGMIQVMPVRGKDLVDVKVVGSDPALVKLICDAVTECYKEGREAQENEVLDKAIATIQEELTRRENELLAKTDTLRKYMTTSDYIGLLSDTGNTIPTTVNNEEAVLTERRNKLSALDDEITQLKTHINKLKSLKDSELMDYVRQTDLLAETTPGSLSVRELYTRSQTEESTLSKMHMDGYGEKHPALLSMAQEHENTKQKLTEGLVGLKDALEQTLSLKEEGRKSIKRAFDEVTEIVRNKTQSDILVMSAIRDYRTEKSRYEDLENEYINQTMNRRASRPIIQIHTQAREAKVPSSPNVKMNLILGAVVGVVFGIGVAFLLNYMDTSVKTLEDVERNLNLPVLGVIPQDIGLLHLMNGSSPDAEAYRILRTNIELKRKDTNVVTLALVSGNAGEGKTTTLCNLAYVFAQGGFSTLMIDADLRRSKLAEYNDVECEYGLSNFLTSDLALQDVILQTHVDNLYILPAGPTPSDASGVLNSYRMRELLDEVRRRFDIVLIDSPPVLGVSDASLIVSKADATIMVVQPRKLPMKALVREKMVIENAGGHLMGVVMNNVDISGDTQYQYYTTYYSYYSPTEGVEPSAALNPLPVTSRSSKRSEVAKKTESTDQPGDDLY